MRDLGAGQSHRYPDLTSVDIVRVRVEFGELPILLPADSQQLPEHTTAVFIDDVQPDGTAQARAELPLDHIESERADEVQEHHGAGEQQQAGTRGHADCGRFPDRRRSDEPVHGAAPGDDDACAQKTYAGDDLSCDTGRIEHDIAGCQDFAEAVLADHHDQRRRRAHDGLSSQSRDLALNRAFQADECCQREGGGKLDEMPATLDRATKQRVSEP
jgi:hypothetical protein